MKEKGEETKPASKNDTIDIPVGKWLSAVRKNPWIVISVILAIALVISFFWRVPTSSGTVSAQVAAANAVAFINSQGQGTVTLGSVSQKGAFYEVKVKFQGQELPVFVTLDGNYIVPNPLPITPSAVPLTPEQKQQPPVDQVVNVTVGDSPAKGNRDAKVVIVEFTDYQCPFCEKFYTETYKQLVQDYIDTGKVRLVVKDFPLSNIHEKAQKAAEAVLCVREQLGDQGYFKMHNILFENQANLSIDNYKKWARSLDVSGVKYDSCLDSGKHEQKVKENFDYGSSLGVTGTPTFFINGKVVRGAQPYEAFKQALDAELAATK